jgi:transposase
MSKFDLQARPIYYQKQDTIKAHVLICFVALMTEKYLELITKLSLREIRLLLWNIKKTQIQDSLTKEIFVFRSPVKEILKSQLANLVTSWNLLPN